MSPVSESPMQAGPDSAERESFVTATIAGQLFGLPIGRVQDVFNIGDLAPVPLAPPDIVGLINLRGRVVTALDIRQRLGGAVRPVEPGAMAIGIGVAGDSYGLVVDRIGEIVTVHPGAIDATPIHLDPSWAALSRGVHRLENDLLVVLDVDAVLGIAPTSSDTSRPPESSQ